MSNQINWKINSLQCYKELNNNKNVVFLVRWECLAFEDDNSVSVSGTQTLDANNSNSFIEYADLTEPVVLSWIKTALGIDSVNAIEQSALDRLEKQKTPTIVLPSLPWAQVALPE